MGIRPSFYGAKKGLKRVQLKMLSVSESAIEYRASSVSCCLHWSTGATSPLPEDLNLPAHLLRVPGHTDHGAKSALKTSTPPPPGASQNSKSFTAANPLQGRRSSVNAVRWGDEQPAAQLEPAKEQLHANSVRAKPRRHSIDIPRSKSVQPDLRNEGLFPGSGQASQQGQSGPSNANSRRTSNAGAGPGQSGQRLSNPLMNRRSRASIDGTGPVFGPGRRGSIDGGPSSLGKRQSNGTHIIDGLNTSLVRMKSTPVLVLDGGFVLEWHGENPKRFCVLRGSIVVTENDLSWISTFFSEVLSIGLGQFTTDAVKKYLGMLEENADISNAQKTFVKAIGSALRSRSFNQALKNQKTMDLSDLMSIIYPKSSAEEIRFLVDSAEKLRSVLNANGVETRVHALTQEEMVQSVDIFSFLEKTDHGYLSIQVLIRRIITAFSDLDEPMILRQLQQAGIPKSHTAIDLGGFQRFLSVNMSQHPCINLEAWQAVTMGYETVLGRAVRRSDVSCKARDVKAELDLFQPESKLTSLLSTTATGDNVGVGRQGTLTGAEDVGLAKQSSSMPQDIYGNPAGGASRRKSLGFQG